MGKNFMNAFKIESISYGWFELRTGKHYLLCSDYLDYDTPKFLLKALLRLIKGESKEEWICWQDEPAANIMQLTVEGATLKLNMHRSAKESFDLETTPGSLKTNRKECWYSMDLKIIQAVDDLLTEFSLYENGNGLSLYEEHWMTFPQEEYRKLKEFAIGMQNQSDEDDALFCTTY